MKKNKKIFRLAMLLTAAMLTLTACEPENSFPDAGDTMPVNPPTPTTAELLVGRWQQTTMDGQSLPSFLIAIDEYRTDGMLVSTVENTSTGVYFADSSHYMVAGDSIFYEEAGWGADEIIHLDSQRLEKSVYISDYNVTSTSGYVRL
jgi:hypothetical protein